MSRWIECYNGENPRWINIDTVNAFEILPATMTESHERGYMLIAVTGPQRYPIKAAYELDDLKKWLKIVLSQND